MGSLLKHSIYSIQIFSVNLSIPFIYLPVFPVYFWSATNPTLSLFLNLSLIFNYLCTVIA